MRRLLNSSILVFAFLTSSSTLISSESMPSRKAGIPGGFQSVEDSGALWQHFEEWQEVGIKFSQATEPEGRFFNLLNSRGLSLLSVASGDVDRDGVEDLILGYGCVEGSFLTVQRGNPGAISPMSRYSTSSEGRPVPTEPVQFFFSDAQLFELDVQPDLLATGDFNADGILDLVAAQLGETEFVFLPGKDGGEFESAQSVSLPGRLTALKVGDVNRPDGLEDIVIGVDLNGASLMVFEGPYGALKHEPELIHLSSGVVSDLELVDLDQKFAVDVLASVGDEIVLVHGRDRQLTLPSQLRSSAKVPEISSFSFGTPIVAMTVGRFLEGTEPQVVLLGGGGELRFMGFADGELQERAVRFSGLNQADFESDGEHSVQLRRVNASVHSQDDLAFVSPSKGSLRIFVDLQGQRQDDSLFDSSQSAHSWSEVVFARSQLPGPILPVRLNGDGLDDLIVLTNAAAVILPSNSGVTLTVNDAGSDLECKQPSNPTGRCTIRGALTYANTHPGEAPFQIEIAVSEITLEATGQGFQGAKYIPPLGVAVHMTINGNGVVIRGEAGFQWGSSATGEKSAGFYLYKFGGKDASKSTIRDVTLGPNGPSTGFYVDEVNGITIENCRLGEQGSLTNGIILVNSAGTTIRGNELHNLSRAGLEILTTSSGVNVLDNFFGANRTGAMPADKRGNLVIGNPATNCLIDGNVFGGLSNNAIELKRVTGTAQGGGHIIQNNIIGLDQDAKLKVPNGGGISLSWHPNTTIGGTSPGQANRIAGNNGVGVRLQVSSEGSILIGNFIGTNGSNRTDLGNGRDGVEVSGSNMQIGGDGNARNVIAFNGTSWETAKGVYVYGGNSTGIKVVGNSIHSNRSLGIGFSGGSDVTENDAGDVDTGPNLKQNFPVLTKVPGTSDIDLTLDSAPNQTFLIQVFANDECDPSGHGEGQTLLDSFDLTTVSDGSGLAFLTSVPEGKAITATATDSAGNTSEFSACARAGSEGPFVVNSTGDDPDTDYDPDAAPGGQGFDGICSTGKKLSDPSQPCNPSVEGDCECTLRAAIQEANARAGKDAIHFNVPASAAASDGSFRIHPSSALPKITDPLQIDGFTQPGADPDATSSQPWKFFDIKIELDGSEAGAESDGMVLDTSDSTIRGLAIHSFGRHGITIWGNGNKVEKNYIGMDAFGIEAQDKGEGTIGVWLPGGRQNVVGPWNLITGYGIGVQIEGQSATGNRITGNLVGADLLAHIPEGLVVGVRVVDGSGNTIGGEIGNTICSSFYGIEIRSESSSNPASQNQLLRNTISIGQGKEYVVRSGILIEGNGNLLGGSGGEGNDVVYAGTAGANAADLAQGVWLVGESMGNQVLGNTVRGGFDFAVLIASKASDNQIGSTTDEGCNVFSDNGVGIWISEEDADRNRILCNRFSGHSGLGISLTDTPPLRHGVPVPEQFRPTSNDRNDLDSGPNQRQNYPLFSELPVRVYDLTSYATREGNSILARLKLDSTPNADFDIRVFAGSKNGAKYLDGKYFCEGQKPILTKTIPTNSVGTGYATVRFPANLIEGFEMLTATATDSDGNTSEFSPCAQVIADQDSDGLPDILETEEGRTQPSSVQIPMSTFSSFKNPVVDLTTTAGSIYIREIFSPVDAEERFLKALGERTPLFWTESSQTLSGGTSSQSQAFGYRGPLQVNSSVVTYLFQGDWRFSSFYNYGPTPDNATNHLYEFLYDGTTGAEILTDRIQVHYLDGGRGDHDLIVNGVIETLGGPVINSTRFFFPQLGDGLAGTIQFQSNLVFANSGGISPLQIDLADSNGEFLDLELGELGTNSLFQFGMVPRESLSVSTPGQDSLKIGYAEVNAGEGVGGTAVFSRTDASSNTLLYEAGVPASKTLTDFSLFVDSLGNRDTGLAIVYPVKPGQVQADANLTLKLYDKTFTQVSTRALTLKPGQHLARFIRELFTEVSSQASEMEGVVTVDSDQAVAAITLRQNDDPRKGFPEEVPTLTTFPVIESRADQGSSTEGDETFFYFPQVGNGQVGNIGFQTSMILVNTGAETSVSIELFNSEGKPMILGLGLGTPASQYAFSLPAGQAVSLNTTGTGDLLVGYAKVTTSTRVGGTAVFGRSQLPSGTLLYEAGVPASKQVMEFSLVVDTMGNRNTGLAIVRDDPQGVSGGEAVDVTLKLYQKDATLLSQRTIQLQDGQHWARFITEIFPAVNEVSEMEGMLEISSPVPLAAVTLRQNDAPGKDFPNEVPTLTTFPVIPAN